MPSDPEREAVRRAALAWLRLHRDLHERQGNRWAAEGWTEKIRELEDGRRAIKDRLDCFIDQLESRS